MRTAILCQETLQRLREEGKTYFKMGIAIHYGRVYLARFIADESGGADHGHRPQREPGGPPLLGGQEAAGRGRGSAARPDRAAARLGAAGDAWTARASSSTRASPSAATPCVQLEAHLPLVQTDSEGGARAWSTSTSRSARRLVIRYAGDAKFKGVRSSFPVYEVDFEVLMQRIWAPWRRRVRERRGQAARAAGCVLCRGAEGRAARPDSLVVHVAPLSFVVMNLYPYNAGHVMVAPRRHVGSLAAADAGGAVRDDGPGAAAGAVLAEVYKPDGINLGMNLGKPAGAGVADHIHLHVVPRWTGDTNFMTVVGETRVIPEDPAKACARLRSLFER